MTIFRFKRDMEFPRQVYWSGFQIPSPGDLFGPGIKPRSPALQADSLPTEPPGKPRHMYVYTCICIYMHTFRHIYISVCINDLIIIKNMWTSTRS